MTSQGPVIKIHPMLLTYTSGEEIQQGDHVVYHGEAGTVEFVAKLEDPQTKWYVEQYGGGCMVLAPSFGRVFVDKPNTDQDLELVSRNNQAS